MSRGEAGRPDPGCANPVAVRAGAVLRETSQVVAWRPGLAQIKSCRRLHTPSRGESLMGFSATVTVPKRACHRKYERMHQSLPLIA